MWRNAMKPVWKEWIDIFLANNIQKWLHLFCGWKWEKQNQWSWPLVLLYSLFAPLSLHPFRWPFCLRAASLCYRPAKQVKKWNLNPDICSPFGCLFAWLLANIWNMLFAFHVTPMSFLHSPYLFWASVCLPIFPPLIPSHSRPEDLTFKWQLFPDLFKKLPLCLVVPTGTTSESRCLTESISRQNSHVGASFGNITRLEVMCRIVSVLHQTVCRDTHGDEEWQRDNVWNWILDLARWLHSTVAHPHIKRTSSSLLNFLPRKETQTLQKVLNWNLLAASNSVLALAESMTSDPV